MFILVRAGGFGMGRGKTRKWSGWRRIDGVWGGLVGGNQGEW